MKKLLLILLVLLLSGCTKTEYIEVARFIPQEKIEIVTQKETYYYIPEHLYTRDEMYLAIDFAIKDSEENEVKWDENTITLSNKYAVYNYTNTGYYWHVLREINATGTRTIEKNIYEEEEVLDLLDEMFDLLVNEVEENNATLEYDDESLTIIFEDGDIGVITLEQILEEWS